jgi:SAM-dependent methyltransferase
MDPDGDLSMKEHYDALYREQHYWGRMPSPLALLLFSKHKPATLLDLGCGQGPDAVYFAGKGVRVTAVDIVPSAIEALREEAARMQLPITTIVGDMRASFAPTAASRAATVGDDSAVNTNDATDDHDEKKSTMDDDNGETSSIFPRRDDNSGRGDQIPTAAFDAVFSRMALQTLPPSERRQYLDDLKLAYPAALHAHVVPISGACFGDSFICDDTLLKDGYADWEVLFYEETWTIARRTSESGEPYLMREARIIARRTT